MYPQLTRLRNISSITIPSSYGSGSSLLSSSLAASSVSVRNYPNQIIKRYNATAFGKAYSEKNPLIQAFKQIQTIPEYQQIDTSIPWGRFIKESPPTSATSTTAISNNTIAHNVDILNRQAMTNLDRINDILKYIPSSSSSTATSSPSLTPFTHALLRRRLAIAENTEDFITGDQSIKLLEKYYLSMIGKDKTGLDTANGHERSDTVEGLLSIARYYLTSLSTEQKQSGIITIQAIDELLDIAIHIAGTNINDLSNISNNDVQILASSLPAAITSARIHCLKILTTRLQNKITLPPEAAKLAEEA